MWVDIGSVALISLSTTITAWCGYESARWTGLQTRLYNQANVQRVAASVEWNRANTLTTIDVATFLRWVAAYGEGHPAEAAFIFRRFRPEMRGAMNAWIETKPLKNANAPATPFTMPQYRLQANRQAEADSAAASTDFQTAQVANERADRYVRLTVIFAAVSFLAGISTKFVYPRHVYVIAVGFVMLIFGIVNMFELPTR